MVSPIVYLNEGYKRKLNNLFIPGKCAMSQQLILIKIGNTKYIFLNLKVYFACFLCLNKRTRSNRYGFHCRSKSIFTKSN